MIVIKSLHIKNSTFFGENVRIDFSPKMNCIMGGRGTGKTTLLSILYWAINQDDNLSKEILSLVKTNLGSGTAEVVFEDEHGNQFIVFKTFGDSPTVKNAEGAYIPFDDFMRRFGIDYFPAGAIERIGLDPRQRLLLFDGYIGNGISDINGQIGITVSHLKQNEIQIKTCKRELVQIKEELQVIGNIDDDMKKVKAELAKAEADAGLKTQFELENKKQAKRALEQNFLAKVRDANLNVTQQIEKLRASISSASALISITSDLDSASIKEFIKSTLSRFQSATQLVDELQKFVVLLNNDIMSTTKASREEHDRAEGAFSNLKQTIAKHRELFQRFNNLSQRATAKKIATDKTQSLTGQLKALMESRNTLLNKLNELISTRATLRRTCAEGINEILGQKVKILIKECSLNESFAEIIKTYLSKFQMRITETERQILEVSTPQALAVSIENDDAEGYAKRCEIDDLLRIKQLFKAFRETEVVFDLEACVCEDAPNFYLGVEDDQKVESFKPTEELSTGQRCTAVLPVIFAMTSRPLLIDQPEDNLDNKYITQSIHQIIRKIKDTRQLVFVTHNPNIPVISDSELNTFLIYFDRCSHVLISGNIQQVKDQIIDLLEGGKDAFERRKNIYGY